MKSIKPMAIKRFLGATGDINVIARIFLLFTESAIIAYVYSLLPRGNNFYHHNKRDNTRYEIKTGNLKQRRQ